MPRISNACSSNFSNWTPARPRNTRAPGLGLALTKRIVEAQGGQVGVTSTPGEGSIFFARLPRVQRTGRSRSMARGTPRAAGFQAPLGPRHRRNARDRRWLVATLNAAGYEVHSSINGADAIKLLDSRRFDAITLDLILPDMSGWDVLRELRKGGPNRDVPVVIVTVLADEGVGVGFAVHDFLEKPIDPQALLGALRTHRS